MAATRTRVGTLRFSVGAGKQQVVRAILSPRARRILRSRHRLAVVVRTRGAQAGAQPVVAVTRITLIAR
jgi:hypothetical protein